MFVIVYINPADAEPVEAFGPFQGAEAAEEAFDELRDHCEHPPEWARTIPLS
jgi:hypothetical protein